MTAINFGREITGDLETLESREWLASKGVGMISENFDADPPFTPRGCIAQAWNVAQVLYAYDQIERHPHSKL